MTIEEYKSMIIDTLKIFPSRSIKGLKDEFIKNGIAINKKQLLDDGTVNPFYGLSDTEILCYLMGDSENISIFEKWEYRNEYNYSLVYEIDDFDGLFTQLSQSPDFDYSQYNELDLSDDYKRTYKYTSGNNIYLKFSSFFSGVSETEHEVSHIKYPVIIIMHGIEKMVEIRFGSIDRNYFENKNFSTDQMILNIIMSVKHYFYNSYKIGLKIVDLKSVGKAINNRVDGAIPYGHRRITPSNGISQVKADDEKNKLPLIDDLKAFVDENYEELANTPTVLPKLEAIINNYEKGSMLDYITGKWNGYSKKDVSVIQKNKTIMAKFMYNYSNQGFCLIRHLFAGNIYLGEERMDYVFSYIIKNRNYTEK